MVGKGDELTPQEAADILGVSPSTVRRYEDRRLLVSRRLPGGHRRYKRADVETLRDNPPGDTDTANQATTAE